MMPLRSGLRGVINPLALGLALGLGFGLAIVPAARAEVPEPDGYRQDDYRGEVPNTLKGATVLSAYQLRRMMLQEPVVVIDVLPQPPRPENLPATTLWRPPAHADIPGSIWLANVGYGGLSPETESYFRKGMDAASFGAYDRKLVFYCRKQCWMSWNAAKRALSYGYTSVYWFPGGVEDWTAAGYPTLLNAPIPTK